MSMLFSPTPSTMTKSSTREGGDVETSQEVADSPKVERDDKSPTEIEITERATEDPPSKQEDKEPDPESEEATEEDSPSKLGPKELERVKELDEGKQLEQLNEIDHGEEPDQVKEVYQGKEVDQGDKPDHLKELDQGKEPDLGKEVDQGRETDLLKVGTEPDQVKEPGQVTKTDHVEELDQVKEPDLEKEVDQGEKLDQGKEPHQVKEPGQVTNTDHVEKPDLVKELDQVTEPHRVEEPGQVTNTDHVEEPDQVKEPDLGKEVDQGEKPDLVNELDQGKEPDQGREPGQGEEPGQVIKTDHELDQASCDGANEKDEATVPRANSPSKNVVVTVTDVFATPSSAENQDEHARVKDSVNSNITGGYALPPMPESSPVPSSPKKKPILLHVDSPQDKTANTETRTDPPPSLPKESLISPTDYHRKFCLSRRKQIKKKKSERSRSDENAGQRILSTNPPLNDNLVVTGGNTVNGGMMDRTSSVGSRREGMMDRMGMSRSVMGGGGMMMNDSNASRFYPQDARMMMMMGPGGGNAATMGPGGASGGWMPGNLQELREMMGRDMGQMGSRGSGGGSIMNKDMRGSMNDSDGSKMTDRQGGRGSPSQFDEDMLSYPGIGTMREPLLPTPADAKPSFKQSYKDISFSPLDKLDRGLMQRMMAFQDNNDPNLNPMGMPSLPTLPNGGMGMPGMPLTTDPNKRKFSDLAYSPRSPNPKKSFLERHRMMDIEMKGHLEEAMSSFGRFQKKFSGNGPGGDLSMKGGHGSAMMGGIALPHDSFVLTGAPLDENPSKKRKAESKSKEKDSDKKKKKSKKNKKAKSSDEKKSGNKALKNTKEGTKEDPSRPKRPFSAYNLFFQLEREAIILAAAEGKDPLDDELEKEYHEKKKSGDSTSKNNSSAKKETPPHDPNLHEPIDPNAPERYRNLRLEKLWYRAGCKTKRRHRKSEGSVGFLELTKMISRRWANIEELAPDIKKYCQKLAHQELELYKKQLEKYKAALKEERKNTKGKQQVDDYDDSDDSDDSDEKDIREEKETNPPKQKQSKNSEKLLSVSANEQGSQTPRAAREALFDPQFSSRLTDLSKMSSFFPQGTPKGLYSNPSMGPIGDGGSTGLPPPPFVDKSNVTNSDIERQMAAVVNAERRLANMAGGPSGGLRSLGHGVDGLSDRAAALADARYRMQMEMQMQGGMMGGGSMGEFSSRGMAGGFSGMFSGGMSDRSQFSNMQRSMMMNQDYFPSGGGGLGGGMMNSQMMRSRFLERFGNNPDNMPRTEDEFDMEVERFLSCLGKEIKENHRRRSLGIGDSGVGGMGGTLGGPYGDRMMNRMMMDQMMMRNDGGGLGMRGGNNMNFSQMRDFRQQLGNDDPRLPEFDWGYGGPNPNGARC